MDYLRRQISDVPSAVHKKLCKMKISYNGWSLFSKQAQNQAIAGSSKSIYQIGRQVGELGRAYR
jgi:hypothetical protein